MKVKRGPTGHELREWTVQVLPAGDFRIVLLTESTTARFCRRAPNHEKYGVFSGEKFLRELQ